MEVELTSTSLKAASLLNYLLSECENETETASILIIDKKV